MRKWISTISVFISALALSACYLIGPPNSKPLADAGPDAAGSVGVAVALNGSAGDIDGDSLSYSWAFSSQPEGSSLSNDSFTGRTSLQASFTPQVAGLYELSLYVSDGKATVSDRVRITVSVDPNAAPVVDAGEDVSVLFYHQARLHGTASDADGDELDYEWSFASIPSGSVATDDDIVNRLTPDASFMTEGMTGVYVLELSVSDGAAIITDQVQVSAESTNAVPEAAAYASDSVCVPGTTVSFGGAATDEGLMSYALEFLSQPTGSGLSFAADSDSYGSGVVMAVQSLALNVEGAYQVRFSATDESGAVGSSTITVTVQATNPLGNSAPHADAGADREIAQSTAIFFGPSFGLDGSGSGDADGDILSFLWECVDGPTVFAGDYSTVDARIFDALSPSTTVSVDLPAGAYVFRLTVDDGQGFGTDGSGDDQASVVSDEVTVTVTDAQPFIYAFMAMTAVVNMDAPAPGNVASLGAGIIDPDLAMDPSGIVVSFLSRPAASICVLAEPSFDTSGGGGSLSLETSFTPDLAGLYEILLEVPYGEAALTRVVEIEAYTDEEGGAHVTLE